jgi:hypothetical protein
MSVIPSSACLPNYYSAGKGTTTGFGRQATCGGGRPPDSRAFLARSGWVPLCDEEGGSRPISVRVWGLQSNAVVRASQRSSGLRTPPAPRLRTWVEIIVVATSRCPRSSWMVRRQRQSKSTIWRGGARWRTSLVAVPNRFEPHRQAKIAKPETLSGSVDGIRGGRTTGSVRGDGADHLKGTQAGSTTVVETGGHISARLARTIAATPGTERPKQ